MAPSDLVPFSSGDITRAARSFSPKTSIGCDAVPPRAIADLSEPLKDAIASVLNEAESTGSWPQEVATSMIHLIPKLGRGRWPIGALPTLIRIWERARKPVAQRWPRDTLMQLSELS